MKKKIYFAGSIRGGRDFAHLYRKIIERIQANDICLTEHIGQTDLNLKEQGRTNDAQIYNQDTAWLRESDMVVAECSNASLGAMSWPMPRVGTFLATYTTTRARRNCRPCLPETLTSTFILIKQKKNCLICCTSCYHKK